jgi:hypothetical protein
MSSNLPVIDVQLAVTEASDTCEICVRLTQWLDERRGTTIEMTRLVKDHGPLEQVEKAVARGISRSAAQRAVEQWCNGTLRPDVIVEFDDPGLGAVPVADILADPARFDGETLADPIEGVAYGRNCAVVQVRTGGHDDGVYIYSFAHGGCNYRLRHDYASIEAAILAGEKSEASNILCQLVFRADVDLIEKKLLAKLAGKRTGAGLRIVETCLKEEGDRRKQKAAEATRRQNAAESTTVRLEPVELDDEAGPVMQKWDDNLCHVDALEPPMRDIEGCPIDIQYRETAGLHELTGKAQTPKKTKTPGCHRRRISC